MKKETYIKLCCLFSVLIIIVSVICAFLFTTPIHVSMVEILANPNKFHGRYIQTEGVWQYEFEDYNLYFNNDARTDMITSPSIWLEIPDEMHNEYYEQLVNLNGRYVTITGYFTVKNTGHFDCSVGAIEKISACEIID